MAIPEELKSTVFAYCRETEGQDTLPAIRNKFNQLKWTEAR